MNSQQLYDAILQGDISCEYFMAWLHEKVSEGYVNGYSDCNEDADKVRERFLSECG